MFICDVMIAGGGMGGVAAALRAAAMGCTLVLTEENKWLGGQMTSQGVSALDELPETEIFGGTALYRDFKERIRRYYKKNYRLSAKGRTAHPFNPGSSEPGRRFSFEPTVGVKTISDMLLPYIKSGQITVLYNTKVKKIFTDKETITGAAVENIQTGRAIRIRALVYIDATELGDMLPLAQIAYSTGVESFYQTHEPSAPQESVPLASQAFGYTFAVEKRPGETHVIQKPTLYDNLVKKHRFSLMGLSMYENGTASGTFFKYRRIIDAANFADPALQNDITLINCICTDYRDDPLIDQNKAQIKKHLQRAKQLALSYLYWLQTKAPRQDGGQGYPELLLRADIMGTKDGLSQFPYIRESRRLIALQTIKEQDIAAGYQSGLRARQFIDSVGIGRYLYTDIHWCCHTKKRLGSGQVLLPFQIPMGALLTGVVKNYIAGAKNIGTTHITNGAFRFHPVEWNIGESAGALAAYAVKLKKPPTDIYNDKIALRLYQRRLLENGIPLYWFDDVDLTHHAFIAIQYLAVCGIISGTPSHLHFYPDQPAGRAVSQSWLKRAKQRFNLSQSVITELKKKAESSTRSQLSDALFEIISKE